MNREKHSVVRVVALVLITLVLTFPVVSSLETTLPFYGNDQITVNPSSSWTPYNTQTYGQSLFTYQTDNGLEFTFVGHGLDLRFLAGETGRVYVTIDDGEPILVDTYQSQWDDTTYQIIRDLDNTEHSVQILARGKNPAASRTVVYILSYTIYFDEKVADDPPEDDPPEDPNGQDDDVFTPISGRTVNVQYDANGNIVNDGTFQYIYNELNQLTVVTDNNGNSIAEYFYDHTGDRIKKVEGGKITYTIGSDFVRDDEGDTVYFYHDDVLVAREGPRGKFFYHPDHLGSTTVVTDSGQNVVEHTEYLPFGAVIGETNERYTFTGQEFDAETGLMYYGARYYNPDFRRFTQPDSLIPNVYDPQQLNRYSYVRNNPLKHVDSSGNYLETFGDVLSLAWSVKDIIEDPGNVWNWVAAGADVVTLALPGVVAGGLLVKAARRGDDVVDVVKAIDKGSDVAKSTGRITDEARNLMKWADETGDMTVGFGKASPKDLKRTQTLIEDSGSKVKRLKKSMQKNGYDYSEPIDVMIKDGDKYIINGHHRARAAGSLGMRDVPIRQVRYDHAGGRSWKQILRDSAEAEGQLKDWRLGSRKK